MPTIAPTINVGPDGPKAYLQPGSAYGLEDSGPFQRFTKRGTQAEVAALAAPLAAAGWLYTVTNEAAGLARIEATKGTSPSDAATEEPEDVWELDPNEVEKNLLEADFASGISGQIGRISNRNRLVLKAALKTPSEWEDGTSLPAFASDGTISNALSLFYLMMNNVESIPIEATVIRHTKTFSNTYVLPGGLFTNVNRIISTSSMYSVEGVPSTILYSVPTPPTVAQYIETLGDLQYGWRKVRAGVTRVNRTKWRTTQNYQFGLWAVKLYGNVL